MAWLNLNAKANVSSAERKVSNKLEKIAAKKPRQKNVKPDQRHFGMV